MTEEYDPRVAQHYAAYRPPIHSMILKQVLSDTDSYSEGLDVGCGTGYSTTALAKYCTHVSGIDPSQSMLEKAESHKKISYLKGAAEDIPLADHSIDIVTFAGSLFYADLNKTAKELRRICRKEALIIAYDFEILLNDYIRKLGIDPKETSSGYDHNINFSGFEGLEELMVDQEKLTLEVATSDLAHILLSDHYRYRTFAHKYNVENPFKTLVDNLKTISEKFSISAEIYYSKYQLSVE